MSSIPTNKNSNILSFLEGASTAGYYFNGVNLFLSSSDYYTNSDYIHFYVSGKIDPTGIAYIPCYLSGYYPSQNNNINCFINGFGDNSSVNCFVKGFFTNTEFPLIGGSGLYGYLPLNIIGTGIEPTGATSNTIIENSGKVNFYINGLTPSSNGSFNLFVKGAGGEYDYVNAFIKGVSGAVESSFDMYIKAYVYNTSGINLFIRGY
jgi:hypothetical protein